MRTPYASLLAAAFAALTFAGCAGGGSSAVPAARSAQLPAARAHVALGVHFANGKTTSSARTAKYVSSATQLLSAAVGSAAPAYFNVAASSPLCAADGSGGRTCTIDLAALPSSAPQTIAVGTYRTAPSNPAETTESNPPPAADLLSAGTTSVTVVAGARNAVDVALAGVPATLAIAHVSSGLGSTPQALAVTAYDASGAQIITSRDAQGVEIPFEMPIALALTESSPNHLTLDAATLAKPSDVAHVAYDGTAPDGYHATITASAGGVTQSATFAPFQFHGGAQSVQLGTQTTPFNGLTTYGLLTLTGFEYGTSAPVTVNVGDCDGKNGKPAATIVGQAAFAAGALRATVFVTSAGSVGCTISVTDGDATVRSVTLTASPAASGPLAVTPATIETSTDGTRGPAHATATITGGVPPYALDQASCAGAANVALARDQITASPGSNSIDCGVFVTDNAGTRILVRVNARVYGGGLIVSPSSISGVVNSFPPFTVSGGRPPYRLDMGRCWTSGIAYSHSTTLTSGGPVDDYSGSLYLNYDGSCAMTIFDANGQSVQIPVTVWG